MLGITNLIIFQEPHKVERLILVSGKALSKNGPTSRALRQNKNPIFAYSIKNYGKH